MAFQETPRFPLAPSFGIVGGPQYNTGIVTLNSGYEQRNQNWDLPKCKYQLQWPLVDADKETFLAWFHAMGGQFGGFRFQDSSDFSTSLTTGRLGTTSAATGVQVYQIYKVYAVGSTERLRKITKPEYLQTISVYRGGVLQTAGSSAGNYAVDTTTGLVTFVADASSSASAITPGSTTSVTLTTNPGTLTSGKLLYLSGFAGADASAVNGIAHTINSVSGSGPFVFVLATNTAGLTITVGSGIGRKFAQAAETLAVVCNFDVPVRFDTDYSGVTYEGPGVWRGESFQIVEIRV